MPSSNNSWEKTNVTTGQSSDQGPQTFERSGCEFVARQGRE